MVAISNKDLLEWDKQRRTTFVNSLWGMRNLCLVGTTTINGDPNLAVFNSLTHLGANPALAAIIIRPDSVDRHTLSNIRATHCFTVNNVLGDFYQQAHQTSARYGVGVSEFAETNLTRLYREGHAAPFVAESTVQLSFSLQEELLIKANNTIMVIGALQSAFIKPVYLASDGFVDHQSAGSIHVSGLDAYYESKPLGRLNYAKVGVTPTNM